MLTFSKFLEPNRCLTRKIGYEVHDPDVCEGLSTNMGNLLYYMHYTISYRGLYCICSMLSFIQTLLYKQYAVTFSAFNTDLLTYFFFIVSLY